MEIHNHEILDDFVESKVPPRRRALLPWWIKIFSWIFLILGGLALISFALGLFGLKLQLEIYGLETSDPQSVTGFCMVAIFLFKGIAALGLLLEKDWAINIGLMDAAFGIAICLVVMLAPSVVNSAQQGFNFRLELVLLIPFLIKLNSIKSAWENQN